MTAIDYTHLLIANTPEYVPTATQVITFLRSIHALNSEANRSPATLSLSVGSLTTSNPFTKEPVILQKKRPKEVADWHKLQTVLSTLDEYDVQVNVRERRDFFPILLENEMENGFGVCCVVKPQPTKPLSSIAHQARFWIYFFLDKWTEPTLRDGRPVFNPKLLALTERHFNIKFEQTYFEG